MGFCTGTEICPSISSSSEFTSSTMVSSSFRVRTLLEVAVGTSPLFLLVPTLLEGTLFERDALFAGIVLVVEIAVPFLFFLVTTVDVTVINAIPNCSSFVSVMTVAAAAAAVPIEDDEAAVELALVLAVGKIPLRSDSSDEIPASSALVAAVLLLADDDMDFSLDWEDGPGFRRFAAAGLLPSLSFVTSEESLENPPLVLAPAPAPAPAGYVAEVLVLSLLVERSNGRTAFKRKKRRLFSFLASLIFGGSSLLAPSESG